MKTRRILSLFLLGMIVIMASCKKKEEKNDPTDPTSDISLKIQQELDDGKDFYDMVTDYGTSALYGKKYEGGLIYHIDIVEGEGFVCAEHDESTLAPWGCPGLYMTESWYGGIGDGSTNTLIIRLDCEDSDIAVDITGDGSSYDHWFLPTTGSMDAINDRVASKDIGNFSSSLYWTSKGYDDNEDKAFAFSFETGNETPKNRGDEYLVRAVRKFEY